MECRRCAGPTRRWYSVQRKSMAMAVLLVLPILYPFVSSLTRPRTDLNLPLCGVSATLATILLDLPTPPGTIREKLGKMDWMCVNLILFCKCSFLLTPDGSGNFIVISSACSATIALTQGGTQAPWSAPRIIGPLVVGILGLIFFFVYEFKWAKHPMVCTVCPTIAVPTRLTSCRSLSTFWRTERA